MTTTVQQIVRGALQLLGVLDVGEAIPPSDAADGLAVFNDMVASWASKGVHTAAASALNDDSPLEERHTKALKNMLAVELAASYGRDIPAKVLADAMEGWQLIAHDYKKLDPLRMDMGLQYMPSQRRYC